MSRACGVGNEAARFHDARRERDGGVAVGPADRKRAATIASVSHGRFCTARPSLSLLADALRPYGFIDGKNLNIDYRCWAQHVYQIPDYAAEFVEVHVDAIAAGGDRASAPALIKSFANSMHGNLLEVLRGSKVADIPVEQFSRNSTLSSTYIRPQRWVSPCLQPRVARLTRSLNDREGPRSPADVRSLRVSPADTAPS